MNMKRSFSSVACAAGATVILGAMRSSVMAAIAPENTVTIYTGPQFSGTELIFSDQAQSATLAAIYKDDISSLKVPEGYVVLLMDVDNGNRSVSFGAGEYSSISKAIDNKTDKIVISSVI